MATNTTSVRVLMSPEFKKELKEAIKNDPDFIYNDEPSLSEFARQAFAFYLAHKSNKLNQVDSTTAA